MNQFLQFVKVSRNDLSAFLKTAREKVIVAKAGYYKDEIDLLLKMAEEGIRVKLFIDANENSVRFGFGEREALEVISTNLTVLSVKKANHIRMSIVAVDDKALVFTPVALSWEEEPEGLDFPNGFFCNADFIADYLEGNISEEQQTNQGSPGPVSGFHDNQESISNVIPFPKCPSPEQKAEIGEELTQAIEVLKKNPPVDPTQLREMTVYRNNYKILKMQIRGAKIRNKTLDLRPFNRMFPKVNERLKTSWQVFTKEDVDSVEEIKKFFSLLDRILKKYTFDAKRFGVLIKVTDKERFQRIVSHAKGLFVRSISRGIEPRQPQLGNSSEQEGKEEAKELEKKSGAQKESLVSLLDKSQTALVEHLFQVAKDQSQSWEDLFRSNRALHRMMKQGEISPIDALRKVVDSFVADELKFPQVQDMIESVDIRLDYYDVSSELLSDKEFNEALKAFELKIRDYSKGYEQTQDGP